MPIQSRSLICKIWQRDGLQHKTYCILCFLIFQSAILGFKKYSLSQGPQIDGSVDIAINRLDYDKTHPYYIMSAPNLESSWGEFRKYDEVLSQDDGMNARGGEVIRREFKEYTGGISANKSDLAVFITTYGAADSSGAEIDSRHFPYTG